MDSDNLNLKTDQLLKTVGNGVDGADGRYIGKIVEITRDKDGKNIEYLILKSDEFFGRGSRFFVIPASSSLVKINHAGKITLQAQKDDVQFAKGISADKCPKPDFKTGLSIYELYKYENNGKALNQNKTII